MAREVTTTTDKTAIDGLLAAALRHEDAPWPGTWPAASGLERILYHGIAGLIAERSRELCSWPSDVMEPVREQAIAQAMWEMRHKPLLARLLDALVVGGVPTLVLKGSALAYDLYSVPAARTRGDTDILIAPGALGSARHILGQMGFTRTTETASDDLALQEVWTTPGDGKTWHHIDLHWQLLNAPALAGVMDFASCAADPLPLPALGTSAMAMSRVSTLLHTCIHRAMHITTPYFVDGATYYGGDRLIWANDINLLAAALSDDQWDDFASEALNQRVAGVALNGLEAAHRALGTPIPSRISQRLRLAKLEAPTNYLLSYGQAQRSWRDLLAVDGWRRKLAYASARALPSANFMRAKYPDMKARPLAWLHTRRVIDLLRPRPGPSGRE